MSNGFNELKKDDKRFPFLPDNMPKGYAVYIQTDSGDSRILIKKTTK